MTKMVKLNSNNEMPTIGLGTFCIQGRDKIFFVIDEALKVGYRMIDTAKVYNNEFDIGHALRTLLPKYGLKRQDIFITSKLSPAEQGGGEKTERALRKSLQDLGLDYIDLYLIHWPGVSGVQVNDPLNARLRSNTWKTLAKLHKQGLARAIGVSNYTVRHINELLDDCEGVIPAVNQVEWHPHYYQPELLKLCQDKGIVLQAYSSLGGSSNKSLLTDPTITKIAKELNKSNAQLLLKWALQQGVAIIPKATSTEHIANNFDLDFIIPPNDIEQINKLKENNKKYAWNPDTVY